MSSLKKILKVWALLGFAGLTLLLAGCSGESPADVAVAFYQAANRGDYAKAEGYLHSDHRMAIKAGLWNFPKTVDAVTKKGSIKRIQVEEVGNYEDGIVKVMLRLFYADGTQDYDIMTLCKVDGHWKIALSKLLSLNYSFPNQWQ